MIFQLATITPQNCTKFPTYPLVRTDLVKGPVFFYRKLGTDSRDQYSFFRKLEVYGLVGTGPIPLLVGNWSYIPI